MTAANTTKDLIGQLLYEAEGDDAYAPLFKAAAAALQKSVNRDALLEQIAGALSFYEDYIAAIARDLQGSTVTEKASAIEASLVVLPLSLWPPLRAVRYAGQTQRIVVHLAFARREVRECKIQQSDFYSALR